MNVVDALVGEHGALRSLLDRLDRDLDSAAGVGEVREQAALLGAALISHAELEDELLFAAVKDAGGPADLIRAMQTDHEAIAAGLRRSQGTRELAAAKDELRTAVQLARRHFDLEERMAFPLAASLLGPVRLVDLGARWAERRAVWLSVG